MSAREWKPGVNVDGDGIVSPVRRLVVINPEDREAVKRLHNLVMKFGDRYVDRNDLTYDTTAAALREFASPTPPIEEPTNLYAVVKDRNGNEWCHIGEHVWRSLTSTGQYMVEKHWHDLDSPLEGNVVKVLSEGVTEGGA